MARDLLRGHEENRPDFLLVGQLYADSLFRSKSKIYDFELSILRLTFRSKLYVLWLYISVNVIHFVDIVQTNK